MLRAMEGHGPVRVLVSLEQAAGTIRGAIAVEGAPPSEFFGWLDLIDRLERAADPPANQTRPVAATSDV